VLNDAAHTDLVDAAASTFLGRVLLLVDKVRTRIRRLARYGATSVICLGISEATLLVLSALGMGATLAALLANLAGVPPSYLLSRYWIWHDSDRRRVGRQVVQYWGVSILSMLLTSGGTGLIGRIAPHGSWHLVVVGVGFFVVSLVLWVAKYLVYEKVIFPRQAPLHR
jgi:putative flippase GtrA